MPTYEYICRACGHEFEEFQSIKADPVAVCPKCRKKKVERKIGIGGAVIFKGGGFYETDYRSESYRSGEEAEKKAGDGEAGAKAEAKAGAKAGAKADDGAAPKAEGKADAEKGVAPAAKREAKAAYTPDSTHDSTHDSTPASKPESKPESKSASKSDAAAAAENRRIESRATHRSRIGRGIGNIVGGGKKPAAAAKRGRKK